MQLGVVFPTFEIGADPGPVRDYALAAEAAGYQHLLAYDHVLGADPDRPGGFTGPYTYKTLFHEPLVLFGYLAAITERLELLTGVLILPQRQTALVAKQAAEVDVLSRGRLRLGVGVGWNAVEYEALGEDFHTRGRRVEEQIALLRQLWAEPIVNFEGLYHSVSRAGLKPLPPGGSIPIWIGGMSDPVMDRVGRIADGWLPLYREPAQLVEGLAKVHAIAEAANRDPASISVNFQLRLSGDIAADIERAHEWEQAGVTDLSVNTMGRHYYEDIGQHIQAIEQFQTAYQP
jgi:probable F420-dependent oxidoreductase